MAERSWGTGAADAAWRAEFSRALIAASLNAGDAAAAVRLALADPSLPHRSGPLRSLAVGKAARTMLHGAASVLGPRLSRVLALVPDSEGSHTCETDPPLPEACEILPCDHPYPTARNVSAAMAVERFVREGDLCPATPLLLLLSGGSSAFLASPAPPLTLDQLASLTRDLQRASASIGELNAVRKHVERLKGGRLAAMHAGPVLALIVSDVIGDRLDVIGSGPVSADPTTYEDALNVLRSRGLIDTHAAVAAHLSRGAAGGLDETPKPGDPRLASVTTRVILSNARVLDGVGGRCEALGFEVVSCRMGLEGSAAEIARDLVERAVRVCEGSPMGAPRRSRVWIAGGEPTVDARNTRGVGGPSQELALQAARLLAGAPVDLCLWAFSTDGRDGPTDAAGAMVDRATWARIVASGIDPRAALREHDSHAALDAAGTLIRTGPTGTNLNHVWVIAEPMPPGTTNTMRPVN